MDLKTIPLSAWLGIFSTSLFAFAAILAPLIAPYGLSDVVGDVWEPMSREHLLGTDNLGRDLLSRMIYGARTTLTIAALATIVSFTLGAFLGMAAAVIGGWADQLLSRGVDLLMSIPTLIFALVVLSVMPVTVFVLIVLMGLLDSTRVFRLARAVAVDINVMDYVEAARLRGEGRAWVIFREILPNCLPAIITKMTLDMGFVIIIASSLSFLGLGVQPPTPDLGSMVAEGARYLPDSWWLTVFPGLAILIAVFGFNLLGDGLREILGVDE